MDVSRKRRVSEAPVPNSKRPCWELSDSLLDDELWLRIALELLALCESGPVEHGRMVRGLVALAQCSRRMLRVCGQLMGVLSDVFAHEHFVEQKSAEWLELRRRKITAAKTGEACGLAPRAVPACFYRVWTEQLHVGESTVIEDMTACDYGNMHEDRVLRIFERVTGLRVRTAGIFVDRAQPYLGMSPDGLVEPCELLVEFRDGRRARLLLGESMLEIKTTLYGMVDKPKCEHATQIMQQMRIRQRRWSFHCYFHSDSLLIYLWRFSDEFWAWMNKRLERHAFYYFTLGLSDVPTEPDEELGLPADDLLVHAIAHETKEAWFPEIVKKGRRPYTVPAHIQALLPPRPEFYLIYEQRERIGPLRDDKRLPAEDRGCWPGPDISDELLAQWPLLTEQSLGTGSHIGMRVLAIRPYLRETRTRAP